ncbi:threonine synthase [Bilophila wadsworthia]|uniref:threonine synthase n=1 Tax=Bilophila wadsworthia TaxID=35833 RepID=UPI002675EB9A|nr:pyridoxal-phosphate dependent enzyme [Bilophila wadsworthia]
MHTECLGLVCRECGKRIPEAECALSCPDCGAPMRVMFSEASLRQALSAELPAPEGRSFLRQWRSILPISDESLIDRVSLGEAETPLLPSHRYGEKLGIPDLYFKVEQGPTLSLKDRGTALCVLKALEFGCKTVCLSSSGNNAASVSAYGSRAGLNPVVFVQKHVSAAKIFKSLVYGGRVVRIDGDMAAASRICGEMVKRRKWFQCGGPNPYRIAAKRTFAYGIVQQLGRAPDTVLIPCGGGAGMVAAHDAFREMFAAGVIDRMPRLVGVQLQACDPTARAFHEGRDAVTPVDKKPSLSDAIMNNNPYWGRYCLQAVRETGGTMISVSDADFIRTIRELGREEGLFTEPAGSVSVAALRYLVKVPGFENPGLTVCNLTGHGLNVPQVATDESETPGVIPPTVEAVEAFLQS